MKSKAKRASPAEDEASKTWEIQAGSCKVQAEIRRNNVACCAAAKTGLDGGLSKPNASSSKSSKLRKARALAIETLSINHFTHGVPRVPYCVVLCLGLGLAHACASDSHPRVTSFMAPASTDPTSDKDAVLVRPEALKKWSKYGSTCASGPDGKEHATHSLQGTCGSFLAIWDEGAGRAAFQALLKRLSALGSLGSRYPALVEARTDCGKGTFGSFLAIWTEGAGGAALQARLECAQEALTKWSKYGFTRAFSSDGRGWSRIAGTSQACSNALMKWSKYGFTHAFSSDVWERWKLVGRKAIVDRSVCSSLKWSKYGFTRAFSSDGAGGAALQARLQCAQEALTKWSKYGFTRAFSSDGRGWSRIAGTSQACSNALMKWSKYGFTHAFSSDVWERWKLVGRKAIVDRSVCSSLKWSKYGFTRAFSSDGAGGAALQARLQCAQEALTKWSKYGFTRAFSSDGKEHATHSLQGTYGWSLAIWTEGAGGAALQELLKRAQGHSRSGRSAASTRAFSSDGAGGAAFQAILERLSALDSLERQYPATYWNLEPYSAKYEDLMHEYQEDVLVPSATTTTTTTKQTCPLLQTYWTLEPYSAKYEDLMHEYQEDVAEYENLMHEYQEDVLVPSVTITTTTSKQTLPSLQTYWTLELYSAEFDNLMLEYQEDTYWNLEPYSAEYEKLMREYQEDVLEPSATDTVTQFFQALNQRDLAKVFSMMSDSVIYENRALNTMLSTKAAVQRFYMNTLPCIPDGAVFVLEDVVDGGDAVGIAWHLELEGIHLPMSRGLGLYKVGEDGKLVYIRDSPEQVLSMALPALSLGSSFLKAALPAVLPAAMELGLSLGSSFLKAALPAVLPAAMELG
eukprot:gene11383-12083_t